MRGELKVLVVDDHPDMVDALARLLDARGYEVRTAHDGVEALRLEAEFQPDCLLLDVSMPLMDGAEVARIVRERRGADITLVAVTGRADLGLRSCELEAMDHWLKKPIDFEVFYRIFPALSAPPAG